MGILRVFNGIGGRAATGRWADRGTSGTRARPPDGRSSRRRRRPWLEPLEDRIALSTITVNTLLDETNPHDGHTSLREAIQRANSHPGADRIDFRAGLEGTINLDPTLGELLITDNLTIDGPGASVISVSGQKNSRVFEVAAGTTVTISGLTIENGLIAGDGGGILNEGTLTVSGDTLSGNHARGGAGGAIANSGTLTVTDGSTLSGNGGGIYNTGAATIRGGTIDNSGTLTVTDGSTLSGNASDRAGGIVNSGTATVTGGSTLSGNFGWFGGGIANTGAATIRGSTLSGNSADFLGGAIINSGTLTVTGGSTLSGNFARE